MLLIPFGFPNEHMKSYIFKGRWRGSHEVCLLPRKLLGCFHQQRRDPQNVSCTLVDEPCVLLRLEYLSRCLNCVSICFQSNHILSHYIVLLYYIWKSQLLTLQTCNWQIILTHIISLHISDPPTSTPPTGWRANLGRVCSWCSRGVGGKETMDIGHPQWEYIYILKYWKSQLTNLNQICTHDIL